MALSLLLWSPLLGALILALMPANNAGLRKAALALSLLHLGLAAFLLKGFDASDVGMQMVEQRPWLPSLGASYHLGVDGLSVWLLVLNALLLPIAILCSWKAVDDKVRPFHALMFALQSMVYGVFLSQDALVFYLFWEASLLPMYFLIGIWGGEQRLYATVKFVLYTLAGSLLMLVAMLWLAQAAQAQTGAFSFDLAVWKKLSIPVEPQRWLFLAFFIAFAIKVPLFPFHTWLPDAHVQAPTAGSVLLAGVLLKLGTYGLMRFNQTLFPEASLLYQMPIIVLCLIGTVYGALMVLVQTDFKKMVAYSSVSHMGLCVLGIFSFNLAGQQGALLTMINHGLSTGALFLIVGIFYERIHSRDLAHYGGAVAKMPVLGLLFLPVAMSSMGVPGTNGFINEFLCLRGAFMVKPWIGVTAALSVILGAAYMLRLTQKVMYGPLGGHLMEELTDLDLRERLVLGALVLLIFVLGVFPNLILHVTEPAVSEGLRQTARLSAAVASAAEPVAAAVAGAAH
jgi:NADH-quinone oxidoreductase subunit M